MESPIRLTYRDYVLLPEDKRVELIEGDFSMTPSPTEYHQRISGRLYLHLCRFVLERKLGHVYYAPFDVILSDENVVQPDILFVSSKRSAVIQEDGIMGPPDLAVEIISRGTRQKDMILKRDLYGKFGVREYWIVDPDARTVEILTWTSRGMQTWKIFPGEAALSSPGLPGIEIPLGEVFD
jgi:Uma2 family endonuclease